MTEDEELVEKAMEFFIQQDYYEAMTRFTKAYNLTGNIRILMLSSEASFKLAMQYLKRQELKSWDTFSTNAIDHYQTCVNYTQSEETKKLATDRINEIKELRNKVKALKRQYNQ